MIVSQINNTPTSRLLWEKWHFKFCQLIVFKTVHMISSELIYNNNVEIDIVLYSKASPSSTAVRNTKIYLTTCQPNTDPAVKKCIVYSIAIMTLLWTSIWYDVFHLITSYNVSRFPLMSWNYSPHLIRRTYILGNIPSIRSACRESRETWLPAGASQKGYWPFLAIEVYCKLSRLSVSSVICHS